MKKNKIILLLILNIASICWLISCNTNGKNVEQLDDNIQVELNVTSKTEKDSTYYHKYMVLSQKGLPSTTISVNSIDPRVEFYIDHFQIDGENTPFIFIYDIFAGWLIIEYHSMKIWKPFNELPTDNNLLIKLRDMSNPVLVYDGTEWIKNH